jgi:WD40 repeat protein
VRRDELATLNETMRRASYIADMNLLDNAMEAGYLVRARELLDRNRPKPGEKDLRGFEWFYHDKQFHRELLTFKAHEGAVLALAYTPDGKKLLSVGLGPRPGRPNDIERAPQELKCWDATTGDPVSLPFPDLPKRGQPWVISSDGRQFASGYPDKVVRVWNLATGASISLEGHTGDLFWDFGFSHDGKRLLTHSGPDDLDDRFVENPTQELKVWDLATRKVILPLDHLPLTFCAALSPDGNLVAASQADAKGVRLWDVTTRQELPPLKDEGLKIGFLTFSPDSKRLAFAGINAELRIWDVKTGKLLVSAQAPFQRGGKLMFSPDGRLLATPSHPGQVDLWDAATGRRIRSFKGHVGKVFHVAFSPDGTRLAATGANGTVKVWDTRSDPDTVSIPLPDNRWAYMAMLSPDGKSVMTFKDKVLQLWDAATGKPRGVTITFPLPLMDYDITPDWKLMPVVDGSNKVTIWDLTTGKAVRTIPGRAPNTNRVTITPDAKFLAISNKGGAIRIWDIDKEIEVRSMQGMKEERFSLHFARDGTRLLSHCHRSGAVMVLDVATGQEVFNVRYKDEFRPLAMRENPAGTRLALGGYSMRTGAGEVRVLDLETGREVVPPLKGHSGSASSLAFSPDGQRLATSGVDATVRLWDLVTGQETMMWRGLWLELEFVSGHRLMGVSPDGTVRTWDATPVPKETPNQRTQSNGSS